MQHVAQKLMPLMPLKDILYDRESILLSKRLTHKYRDGWSYLDQTQEVGAAIVVCKDVAVNDGDGYESWNTTLVMEVQTYQPEPLAVICEAITDSLSGSYCQHEHDCCGCLHTSVIEVVHATNGKFLVETSSARNY